ncbi:putative E3 ubiquitin-protein ligase XBAT31 [Spatholobus suberectus]|nr:putative E3 ubiquitin-protein ligase XBAT31 [Spatholobus suberectus]
MYRDVLEKLQAVELKNASLTAYNHNLDTSGEYYPSIMTTKTYDERLKTLELVSLNYATSALGRCAQSKFRTVATKCTLGLCCHNKPNPATACLTPPVCPFCQSTMTRLIVMKTEGHDETDQDSVDNNCSMQSKSRKLKNLNSSGSSSSSFKGLSCVSSFGKGGCSSGRIAAEWLERGIYQKPVLRRDIAPHYSPIQLALAESAEYKTQLAENYIFKQIGEQLPNAATIKDVINSFLRSARACNGEHWRTFLGKIRGRRTFLEQGSTKREIAG